MRIWMLDMTTTCVLNLPNRMQIPSKKEHYMWCLSCLFRDVKRVETKTHVTCRQRIASLKTCDKDCRRGHRNTSMFGLGKWSSTNRRSWDWCPNYWGVWTSHHQNSHICWKLYPLFSWVMWNIGTFTNPWIDRSFLCHACYTSEGMSMLTVSSCLISRNYSLGLVGTDHCQSKTKASIALRDSVISCPLHSQIDMLRTSTESTASTTWSQIFVFNNICSSSLSTNPLKLFWKGPPAPFPPGLRSSCWIPVRDWNVVPISNESRNGPFIY